MSEQALWALTLGYEGMHPEKLNGASEIQHPQILDQPGDVGWKTVSSTGAGGVGIWTKAVSVTRFDDLTLESAE